MKRKTKMTILILLSVVLVALIAFLLAPSKVQSRFAAIERTFLETVHPSDAVFTAEELQGYPQAVRNFYIQGGYIGKQKMSGLKAYFPDTPFSLGVGKPMVTIDYTQLNRADRPERYARISSRIYGLPFEGLDAFSEGKGSMEGYLAKFFRLFNQRGDYMDKASLVTYLAEAFFLPSVALSGAVTYEEIDELHVKATMKAYGMEVSGIFTFLENGEMVSFTTNDRMAASFDGRLEQIPWTAQCSDYTTVGGIRLPGRLKATWHYPEGDLLYFDGKDVEITLF